MVKYLLAFLDCYKYNHWNFNRNPCYFLREQKKFEKIQEKK